MGEVLIFTAAQSPENAVLRDRDAEAIALSSIRDNMDVLRAEHRELTLQYTAVGIDQTQRDEMRRHLGRLDRILYPEAYS